MIRVVTAVDCLGRGAPPGTIRRCLPVLLLIPLVLGCVSRPRDPIGRLREEPTSPKTFERVLPYLEALRPGDDFRLFAAAKRTSWVEVDGVRRPIVVIPAWITSLSGAKVLAVSSFGECPFTRNLF